MNDTKQSPGATKKRSLTNEKEALSSEEKDQEPAAGDTATALTSHIKTPRAPVVKVKKTVTKTGAKRHKRQEQRAANSTPGAGGKKRKKISKVKGSVPSIPAGSGVKPAGMRLVTEDKPQDSSSSPAASSPSPPAAVSTQEGGVSAVCSTDANSSVISLEGFRVHRLRSHALWMKMLNAVPQAALKAASLSEGYHGTCMHPT